MKSFKFSILFTFLVLLLSCAVSDDSGNTGNNNSDNLNPAESAIVADHTCTDLGSIPDEWIQKVKETVKIHYCHTSHGGQISEGLERLMNGNFSKDSVKGVKYNFYPDYCNMPDTTEYLSMMEGQYIEGYCETYVTPDLYWDSDYALNITRYMLNNFDINVSAFAWCTQMDYYSSLKVDDYLAKMTALEKEYPDVVFIYMTGNAQSPEQNRYERNNQIRDYCKKNNKVLFDFADLDCWYNGQQYTEDGIPMEHPHYHGDEAAHTTYESCENKAKAFWWLLARLSGWDGKQN